ncbi:MAG: WYL domain-containing protein [Pseudoflavonifractor sp.]
MARGANQKLKLPLLEEYLLRETDEDHPVTVTELIEALAKREVTAERKSVYDDMEALRELGLDVQCRKGHTPGWFVGERHFQLAELKLLVDAVQSCKFITRRKSDALIRKLESLSSRHQAQMLQRQVYVSGRVKSMNESVYYNIDKLHAAISGGHAVTFKYFEYNVKKEKVFRREGKRYQVSPYGLIWDDENYYLAGFDHLNGDLRHYRVDKMAELAVTCLPRQGGAEFGNFDVATYAQKHFGMFSGREGQITLRCKSHLVGVVLDRFGHDVMLVPDGADHFTVTVLAVVSPQFMGWLFGLGDGVTIISPGWAKDAFETQLRAVAEEQMRGD